MLVRFGNLRGRFEQAAGVGMGRTLGDLLGASYFNNLSPIHDSDAGGEIAYDRHRMRNEQVGKSEITLQLRKQVDDLGADADVERGYRLVANNEFGAKGEGAGNADALPLSAGEFMRVAAEGGFVEAHSAQEFDNAAAKVELRSTGQPGACPELVEGAAFPTLVPVNDERFGDDVLHAKARVERGERVLKDDLQVAPKAAHFAPVGCKQVATFEQNRAGSRLNQAQNQASERALAGAGFADQAQCLSAMNFERNVVDGANFTARFSAQSGVGVGENFREVADFQQGHVAMLAVLATDLHGLSRIDVTAEKSRPIPPKSGARLPERPAAR